MQLEHSFSVPAGIDDVWEALLDPERVAPCMPGATLTSVDGPSFTGKVKVKLGPVSMQYKGTGEYARTDEPLHTVVIEASGKDAKGNGTAKATVTLVLTGDGAATEGNASTDLEVTGKPAQFGRGMISEVGDKILEQFAANLAEQLGSPTPTQAAASEREGSVAEAGAAADSAAKRGARNAEQSPAGSGTSGTPDAGGSSTAAAPSPRPSAPARDADALDLSEFAGAAVAKRAAPAAGAALFAVLIVVLLVRRRRDRTGEGPDSPDSPDAAAGGA